MGSRICPASYCIKSHAARIIWDSSMLFPAFGLSNLFITSHMLHITKDMQNNSRHAGSSVRPMRPGAFAQQCPVWMPHRFQYSGGSILAAHRSFTFPRGFKNTVSANNAASGALESVSDFGREHAWEAPPRQQNLLLDFQKPGCYSALYFLAALRQSLFANLPIPYYRKTCL